MHKEILEDIGEKELINRLGKFMPKNQKIVGMHVIQQCIDIIDM